MKALRVSREVFYCPFGHPNEYQKPPAPPPPPPPPPDWQVEKASLERSVDALKQQVELDTTTIGELRQRLSAETGKDTQERLAKLCLEVAERVFNHGQRLDKPMADRLRLVHETGDLVKAENGTNGSKEPTQEAA